MIFRPRSKCPQNLIPLKLKILPTRQKLPSPHTCSLHDGKALHKIFPTTPFSIRHLKFSQESYVSFQAKENHKDQNILDGESQQILQLRRPPAYYFNSGCHHVISGLTLPSIGWIRIGMRSYEYSGMAKPSTKGLNMILKQAKNLNFLVLGPECEISTFKSIRKVRNLEYLSINLTEKQIIAFPQLFKGLTRLREVKLNIRWGKEDVQILSKFFGFLPNLPKIQHLTILLDDNFGFYKPLLSAIHAKSLPSFHISVSKNPLKDQELQGVNWDNCIDTLYIGSMRSPEDFSYSLKKQEKKLSLKNGDLLWSNIKLIHTVKNFVIADWNARTGQSQLGVISEMKSLENLTFRLDRPADYSNYLQQMNEELSRIEESLGNLTSFTFDLKIRGLHFDKFPLPFVKNMKSLKTFDISLDCYYIERFCFTEELKDLVCLEKFCFEYIEGYKRIIPGGINCDFSFEKLKNLKAVDLFSNVVFEEKARDKLIQGIEKLENLESLVISGTILDAFEGEKVDRLKDVLNSKKKLEVVRLTWWKEVDGGQGKKMSLKRVNGEIVFSEIGEES